MGDVLAGAHWSANYTLTDSKLGAPSCITMDAVPQNVQLTVLPYDGGGFINVTNHGSGTWEAGTVVFTILIFVVD